MDLTQTLMIAALVGLIVGFIVHAVLRYAQGPSLLATLLAGVLGALIAVYYIAPNVAMLGRTAVESTVLWSVIGSLILSTVMELFFIGSRRGRVLAS